MPAIPASPDTDTSSLPTSNSPPLPLHAPAPRAVQWATLNTLISPSVTSEEIPPSPNTTTPSSDIQAIIDSLTSSPALDTSSTEHSRTTPAVKSLPLATPRFVATVPDHADDVTDDELVLGERLRANPLSRPGYVSIPARTNEGPVSPEPVYQELDDEALARQLAGEESADQASLFADLEQNREDIPSTSRSGGMAEGSPVFGSDLTSLEYDESDMSTGTPATPFSFDPYAPYVEAHSRSAGSPRREVSPSHSVAARNIPKIIITRMTPSPSPPPDKRVPAATQPRHAMSERQFEKSRAPSLPELTDSLVEAVSQRLAQEANITQVTPRWHALPDIVIKPPPAHDSISLQTARSSTVVGSDVGTSDRRDDAKALPGVPPKPAARRSNSQRALAALSAEDRWWAQSLSRGSLRFGECEGCKRVLLRRSPKERGHSLYQRLRSNAHFRCHNPKPNCPIRCSGCGRAVGACTIRDCLGQYEDCEIFKCCFAVHALAVHDALTQLQLQANPGSTLGLFDVIRKPSLVIEVAEAIAGVIEQGPNSAHGPSSTTRAKDALRWSIMTSPLFHVVWTLADIPKDIGTYVLMDKVKGPAYRAVMRLLMVLKRFGIIDGCEQPACMVDFPRVAMEAWLMKSNKAPHLPELIERQDLNNFPLVGILQKMLRQRQVRLEPMMRQVGYDRSRGSFQELLNAIDELLLAFDVATPNGPSASYHPSGL